MSTFNSSLFASLEDGSDYGSSTNVASILNNHVNFMNHENTHTLQDALVAEATQMRGVECYYLPSDFINKDNFFGEDLQREFNKAWKFAAYVDSFEGYSGQNSFFSKFGMQVNDEITLSVNPKLFKYQTTYDPKEGDLIYFKMDNSLFEIVWVEPYSPFYQVGQNCIRKITAQKFVYSGEKMQPKLQKHDALNLTEFTELDLEPIALLDGQNDTTKASHEIEQIHKQTEEIVDPFVVINGTGVLGSSSPFDDNFID